MVSEIQVDDEETRQQLLLQGFLSTAAATMEKIGRFTTGQSAVGVDAGRFQRERLFQW